MDMKDNFTDTLVGALREIAPEVGKTCLFLFDVIS
jgi:hypothetical protein